jgi:hypothetical protein
MGYPFSPIGFVKQEILSESLGINDVPALAAADDFYVMCV